MTFGKVSIKVVEGKGSRGNHSNTVHKHCMTVFRYTLELNVGPCVSYKVGRR